MNNIKVDRSIVGSINTGNIKSLDVSLSNIKQSGNEELADSLKKIAEAIVNSKDLKPKQKDEAIEGINFISDQAQEPPESRKLSLLRTVITKQIPATINLSASLMTIWTKAGPIIKSYFNLS